MAAATGKPGSPLPVTAAPGPEHSWWLGSAPSMKRDPLGTLVEAARHAPVARMRFGPFPSLGLGVHALVLRDPEDIAHVLVHNQGNYVKAPTYAPLRVFLGDGLLTSEGETWRRHRRLIQPVFHHRNIETLAPTMRAAGQTWLEGTALPRAGETLDLAHEMSRLTLDVAVRCFFGATIRDEDGEAITADLDELIRYAMVRIGLPALVDHLPLPRVRRARRAMDRVRAIADRLLRVGEAAGTRDLAALLREARDEEGGGGLTPEQVRDHALTFLLAGHETSANALTWALYLLDRHPAWLERLHAELDATLGGRPPDTDDLPHLEVTRRVLDEAMRLYPPAWVVERQALAEDVVGGYRLPSGSMVITSAYLVHRDPALWEEPERFDPDRFLPAPSSARARFAYFPFGGGGRACIGREFALTELTLLLALLCQRLAVRFVGDVPPEVEALITLRPRGGMPVRITPRPTG